MATEDGRMEFSTADQIDRLPGRVDALEAITAALPTTYQTLTAAAEQGTALAELIDNGPKNIFHTSAATETISEVTFTNNGDGTWTTTATGATAARRAKQMTFRIPASMPAGRYIITGCPPGGKVGTTIKYCLYLMDSTTNSRIVANDDDTGDGFAFDWVPNAAHTYSLIIDIRAGSNPNNLTWKPMICLESAWKISNKFVAYAPTNAELYAMIQSL